MYITIKSLMGAETSFKCRLAESFIDMQIRYALESVMHYEQMKFIYKGKSMLNFANAFKSLRELGIRDGDTVHMVLRLGGPEPQEEAVFEYVKLKQVHHGNMPPPEEFTKFFEEHVIGDVCGICNTIAVNRVLSCLEHTMCKECYDGMVEKKCVYCIKENVVLL